MLTDEHIKYFENFDWKRLDEIVVEVKVAIAKEKKQKAIKKKAEAIQEMVLLKKRKKW